LGKYIQEGSIKLKEVLFRSGEQDAELCTFVMSQKTSRKIGDFKWFIGIYE